MTSSSERVSEYFGLPHSQGTLDFVDIDIVGDTRVFVDPRALRLLPSDWGAECVQILQHFFQTILECIEKGNDHRAQTLLASLREPNETHLGLSEGRARGRALGPQSAIDVWSALKNSEAAQSGLLEDLEDTVLLVEGIGPDIISDICTNIIRGQLIHYTAEVCVHYGIPLQSGVDSGPIWNPTTELWEPAFVNLPVARDRKLLLVPKIVVRRRLEYDQQDYFDNAVLPYLMQEELSSNTELVQLLKSGKRVVYKKDLKHKYGSGIGTIVRETLRHPEVLHSYRREKTIHPRGPLDAEELDRATQSASPGLRRLYDEMKAIPSGEADFKAYELAIEKLMVALFYPALTMPTRQQRIHDGRKIIDLTFVNAALGFRAQSGFPLFFSWIGSHYPAMHVIIECKNYDGEVSNPAIDQLAGRFSPARGRFGFLVCRRIHKQDLLWQRCRDTAADDRGYIVPFDDIGLLQIIDTLEAGSMQDCFRLLKGWFDRLIM